MKRYRLTGHCLYCLIVLALILPLCAGVSAVEFRSYKIVADIEGDAVNEDILITLFNDARTELKSATISVPPDSMIISVSDLYGDLEYQTSLKEGTKIDFNFSIPVKPGEERLLSIKLKTEGLVREKGDYFEYLLVFTPKRDIPEFEHVLKLPKNAKLYSPGRSFQMMVPEANISREKDFLILVWKTELNSNEPEVFLVRFKPDHNQIRTISLEILASLLLVVIFIVIFGFFCYKIRVRYKNVRTINSLKILNERERRVVEEVIKKEGIKQSELLDKLGYTKASLSKILSKLESRGLIKKKKIGKVNKLYLGDKIG